MQFDFEIQRATRRCAATDRRLEPGETFYSTLHLEGAEVVRRDYAVEAWQGPPQSVFGWWKSRVGESDSPRPQLAPNDVLLELFQQLSDQPDQTDMRFVLALLLIRRRVLRIDERPGQGSVSRNACLTVYSPKTDETFELTQIVPDEARVAEIQQHLVSLLYADAA